MSRILVGTTSWTEKTLVESGRFYPPDVHSAEARLRYYATQFPVVEVDSSYYGLPSERNASLWVERMPDGFVFDVKAFRLFTHQHQTPPEALPRDIRALLLALPESRPTNVTVEISIATATLFLTTKSLCTSSTVFAVAGRSGLLPGIANPNR